PCLCTSTAPPEIYTLSLHDALPIYLGYWKLSALLAAGARVKATRLSGSFGFAQYLAARPDHPVIPLFALNPKGYALPFTPDEELQPGAGWTVIGLHEDDANGAETPAAGRAPDGS